MRTTIGLALALALLIAAACVTQATGSGSLHRWWSGYGPVLPHDEFPANCNLCHVGNRWDKLVKDFKFDHYTNTGVRLEGAHKTAQCLRCHNDRGPVEVFAERGCAGCHEDRHEGDLGQSCDTCHNQRTWRPDGMIEKHNRTRLPLTGAHATVSCDRCHPGARVGNFVPTDAQCVTCHSKDVQNTKNPPHLGLGWVDNCDRCHMTTRWEQATVR